ncbi:Hypothetical protein, putative [Bodo saltans]|uniref:Right handed beta helix domain-containing protein n=1 Tax=Bodo saltans TaxID=75058 RepID=A0A0S4IMV2_BODSA|nr:Hypothetical protein, putative [Bodo saltans]|eukprot:CUE73015.1 Hypothetical protein, putative [Bodo saltans]
MDHVDILGCIEAITLQSDEPTTVNPVGHADDTTEVLRHVSVRCCVNGIRIGNRRDVQVQNCSVNTCALVGIELTAPPSSSILSNVPSSVMVVDSTVQGCRSGVHLDGEACMPIFGSSSGGTGGDGTTSFYGSAALATRGEGGCSVSFCGSGVTVTNGSVPRMEHLTIRQCVKGLVVSEHATGLFRRIEISGCEAGVQVSTGDEEYPTFQHCLIYDCPVVGVYLDRRAAGQVIDSTIFECGVGVMFTEGSYSYLAHTKISHPSNNTISKKNDAMRVAKYATPRLGPGIDMQYQSSPSHNSRTARMRRTDREKEREAYQEDVLPKLMAEWDSKKTAISENAETFLESFGMRGRCMMTLPLPVVTALQVPEDSTLMLHPSSGRFPIAAAGSSSNTRGNLFAANVVDLDTPHRSGGGGGGAGVVIPHSNSGKFVYAIEASGAVQPLSLMVPSEFNEIPTIATSPQNSNTAPTQPQQPILPCWTVHATRQAIFDACTSFDEKEATLVLLGSGSGATSALSTPPPELASTASSGLQQRRSSPPPAVASAKQTTGAVATSTLPIGVPQITPLPTMKHHVAGNVALSASPSEVLVGTPGGANESLDDDRLITTTSLLDPTDESNSTNKAPQHWVMSVFPLPPLPRHAGPTWASRKNREGPLSSEGAGTLSGLASRNNQSNYALDAILKERAHTTTSPPLPRSANVSSGEESDDVSDDGPPQPPSATRSPSTAALRGQQQHRYHHHEDQTDASHASLFAAHLRRRGSEIANVYTVKELQSMEDHAEDDVAIQLGLHHRHTSAAGEVLAASLPLLPPIKIAPPPGKPYYPTSAGLQFAEAQHQLKLKGDGNQPSAAMPTTGSRSLPPLPSQRTLRLLQRPQTNLLTPEIADELAYITTQHNSIYAQQILTIFTRLDARHCGGATSNDCRRFLRQLLARCEGGDASGGGGGNVESSEGSSDSSGDEGDVAELPPGTLEAAAATNATPAATAKKKKKRKPSFGSSARRRRSSSKKTAAAVHYPLVEGFVIPPKVLFDAQQQQRRRIQRSASVAAAGVSPSESATTTLLGAPTQLEASSNGSRPVTRESTTPVPPGDEQQQTAVPPPPPPKPAAVILSPATIDSIVLKLIVNQLFESVHKIPETDILTLSEFEQLLSTHQRLKQSGRLPAAIQTTFPWMGMPQPMVEGGEEPTAAAPAQELFRGNVNRGGSQIQPRSGKDSDVVPLGRLNRENAR